MLGKLYFWEKSDVFLWFFKASSSIDDFNGGKRKRKAAENVKKKMKTDWDQLGSSSDEDKNGSEYDGSDHEDDDNDSDEDVHR